MLNSYRIRIEYIIRHVVYICTCHYVYVLNFMHLHVQHIYILWVLYGIHTVNLYVNYIFINFKGMCSCVYVSLCTAHIIYYICEYNVKDRFKFSLGQPTNAF